MNDGLRGIFGDGLNDKLRDGSRNGMRDQSSNGLGDGLGDVLRDGLLYGFQDIWKDWSDFNFQILLLNCRFPGCAAILLFPFFWSHPIFSSKFLLHPTFFNIPTLSYFLVLVSRVLFQNSVNYC